MNDAVRDCIDVYLQEYTRENIIARYVARTAGAGIAYVLENVYAPVYADVIDTLLRGRPPSQPFRILEYGCGGGMNLLKLVEIVQSRGARVERGYGTDFSAPMIEAAQREAVAYLPRDMTSKLTFLVARNETLLFDLARLAPEPSSALYGGFDIVIGVNTFRYAHRLGAEDSCARDLFALLRPGGYSIMIDMNRRFPLFRSRVRDLITRPKDERYIPSLRRYAEPFGNAGFEIDRAENFCWIPHSASSSLLRICRSLAPVLDACCRPLAMRSLVVAHKPG